MTLIRISKGWLTGTLLLLGSTVWSQTIEQRLQTAYNRFSKDPQLKYASHSLLVMEQATGKIVFAYNSRMGLAPASTQKVVTAAAAYSILRPEFRYQTRFDLKTTGRNSQLLITSSGDPSLGSERFSTTQSTSVLKRLADFVEQQTVGILSDTLYFIRHPLAIDPQRVPDGWVVQDIGNYYGAGAGWFNWRENQYDMELTSNLLTGRHGSVEVLVPDSLPAEIQTIDNRLTAGKKGSGDNAYIYLPLAGNQFLLKGTIPPGEKSFRISGAVTDPESYFSRDIQSVLGKASGSASAVEYLPIGNQPTTHSLVIESPGLDSLSYWFLRKSINLYGEAFLKTIGLKEGSAFSTEEGLAIMRRFWQQQGIDSFALRMRDGSGLSPENRITTESMVQVLRFAKKQDWFESYFAGFPLYNGMRMKSGTISAVKGFCGYQRSGKTGKEYVFAFLVNNYNGSSGAVVGKMYQVLNELK